MNISDANTYRDAAVAAIDAGDYATARTQIDKAIAALGTAPDSEAGDFSIEWSNCRKDLLSMSKMCTQRLSAASGIQVSKVTYANPEGT